MFLNVYMADEDIPGTKGLMAGAALETASHEDLLSAIAENGDKDAFITLFEHFAPRIKSFLMKGGMTPVQADELAQETMLTIWRKADRFNPDKAAASTWIFTIARNKKIDFLRKHMRYYTSDADMAYLEDSDASPRQRLQHDEESDILKEAIKALPPEQSDLLYKSFFEDKSHSVIADETGIALGTVKSRIRLALDRLRGSERVQDLW